MLNGVALAGLGARRERRKNKYDLATFETAKFAAARETKEATASKRTGKAFHDRRPTPATARRHLFSPRKKSCKEVEEGGVAAGKAK